MKKICLCILLMAVFCAGVSMVHAAEPKEIGQADLSKLLEIGRAHV